MIKCGQCGVETDSDDARGHNGQMLCEDCYIDALSPAKACDPWAVRMATGAGQLEGAGELNDLQKKIVDLLAEKGEMYMDDLPAAIDVSEEDLKREFATLRHMEKVSGGRRDGKVYVALKT